MRILGIDLAVKAEHRAVVVDERGRFVTPVLKVTTRAEDLERLLVRAREGAPRCKLYAVMEPTGMAWFPVAVYLIRHGVTVYLVNSQTVIDLRRVYHRHAKSDRIDTRVLAQLPLHNPENLHQLKLGGAVALACQRGCSQLDRWARQIAASKNRLKASLRFAWPGIETVFADLYALEARWFAEHWLDPHAVLRAGGPRLQQAWHESGLKPGDSGAWVPALVALAQDVIALYGPEPRYLAFELLQAEVQRDLALLANLEAQAEALRLKTVRPLYRQLQPDRLLETIPGVGQDGAAVYASFVGCADRFDSARLFRGWSGMVPQSKESAEVESKGLPINHAGPRLIKKYAFLDAEVARQWDPQVAALYYDQMVNKGKHHNQAICACATHLLDRVFVVLRDHKPYEVRDVDGQPVTVEEARTIIAEEYKVPEEVRRRTTKRYRQARRDQRAEKKQKREEARTGVRSKP
jgi:transposase